MYIITSVFERARNARLFQLAKWADNRQEAFSKIQEEVFDSTFLRVLDKEQKDDVVSDILEKTSGTSYKPTKLSKDDIMGAFSSFALVFISALPIIFPFLIFPSLNVALHISNAIAFLMLFMVGYRMAAVVGKNKLQTGIVMTLVGISIVTVTVALEG